MSRPHHVATTGQVHPCQADSHGRCAVCERIAPGGPKYSPGYHRLFDPATAPPIETPPAVEATRADEATGAPAPDIGPIPDPVQSTMLAGDLVASLTAALGVDKAAGWIAKQLTGVPNCGCESRKLKLNALDARARRLLARLAGRRPRDGAATAGPAADMDPPAFGRAEGGFIARRALREFGEGIADDD